MIWCSENGKRQRALCLAAPFVVGEQRIQIAVAKSTRIWPCVVATASYLLAILRYQERRQGVRGGVCRMPKKWQAKSGFNRLQQRKVVVKARVLNAMHSIVRDGDEHHSIVEVGWSVAVGTRQQ